MLLGWLLQQEHLYAWSLHLQRPLMDPGIDPNGNDIYSEIATGLRERGYITNNLETRYQARQRQ